MKSIIAVLLLTLTINVNAQQTEPKVKNAEKLLYRKKSNTSKSKKEPSCKIDENSTTSNEKKSCNADGSCCGGNKKKA